MPKPAIALVLKGVDRTTAACGMDRQTLRGEEDQETVRGTVCPTNGGSGNCPGDSLPDERAPHQCGRPRRADEPDGAAPTPAAGTRTTGNACGLGSRPVPTRCATGWRAGGVARWRRGALAAWRAGDAAIYSTASAEFGVTLQKCRAGQAIGGAGFSAVAGRARSTRSRMRKAQSLGQQGTLTRIWARSYLGPARHQTPHTRDTRTQWAFSGSLGPVAFTGSLEWRGLPGARQRGRAGPALRQHGGDECPPRRDRPHRCCRSSGK